MTTIIWMTVDCALLRSICSMTVSSGLLNLKGGMPRNLPLSFLLECSRIYSFFCFHARKNRGNSCITKPALVSRHIVRVFVVRENKRGWRWKKLLDICKILGILRVGFHEGLQKESAKFKRCGCPSFSSSSLRFLQAMFDGAFGRGNVNICYIPETCYVYLLI